MPGRRWRSWKDWTVGCRCGMKGASSLPRSAAQSGIPPKRPRAFRTCSCPTLRCPRPGRTLDRGSRTTGLKGREREGSRGHHRQRGRRWQAQSRLPRKPTFLERERWKAIQKARRKGMSLRAIERELGIHRATVRKYLNAEGPPTRRPWRVLRRLHLIPWQHNRVTFLPAT